MTRSHLVTTIVLLTLATPTGLAAGWSALGNHEPSTALDTSYGFMFQNPDTTPLGQQKHLVYFNGFMGEEASSTSLNPNSGTADTAIVQPIIFPMALLGVWKDCNKDGFVGFGDQGLFEYRSTLLLDSSVCPIQPLPAPKNYPTMGIIHNDGSWVHEFVPIEWSNWHGDVNPFNINDNGARVWMDTGTPGEPRALGSGGSGCYINPQPAGTFQSTGGLLGAVDCQDGWIVTDRFDSVADSQAPLAPYSFSDASRAPQNSASKLNFENPWGSDANGQYEGSYVQPWDCSKGQVTSKQVSAGGTAGYTWVNVSQPRVPPATDVSHLPKANPTGSGPLYDPNGYSPGATANATGAGFDSCDRATSSGDTRHWGNSAENAPYAAEGTVTNSAPDKTDEDYSFTPAEGVRPAAPAAAALGPSTPPNLGVESLPPLGDTNRPFTPDGVWQSSLNTIGEGTARAYFTYYAYVSPAAISGLSLCMPKDAPACGGSPTVGTYGQESCQGASTGVVNGWDCDASHWYVDDTGTSTMPTTTYFSQTAVPTGQTPGSPYDMLDVDCYDQGTGATRGVATIGTVGHTLFGVGQTYAGATGRTNPFGDDGPCA